MKNNIIGFLSLLLLVWSCGKKNTDFLNPAKDKELLGRYFSAATAGVISSSDNLKYILNEPVTREIPDEELQKLIKLTPSVSGKVHLVNNIILTFTPDNTLSSNQTYTVSIDLKSLDSQRYQENISYQIKTLTQDFSVEREGLLIGENGAHTMLLNIKTADKADAEKLKSCINSDADNMTITDQGNQEYQMELIWNKGIKSSSHIRYDGKNIGSDTKGKIEPFNFNAGQFDVLSTYYKTEKKEYNIYFTQQLSKNMDMTGLLQVNGRNAEYTIKDNLLTVFLGNITNQERVELYLNSGIKSATGKTLSVNRHFTLDIRSELPEIKFVSEGNYFPSGGDFKIPVKTRMLRKMRIVVLEIKQQNVMQYLAWNSLNYSDYYTLRKFGKPVFDEIVNLNQGIRDADGWAIHGIDLSDRIKRNPGSIYHIGLEFAPEFTTLACSGKLANYNIRGNIPNADYFKFMENYYRDYTYYDEGFNWEESSDPCKLSFYFNQSTMEKMFICSDYSIIAKKAGSSYHVALSRLDDLSTVSNATIALYNLQGERISEKTTDSNGFAVFDQVYEDATVVEMKSHGQITYLALNTEESNTMTEFDVSGERSEEETAFYVYSERDVYRPGDSIFVNLMVNKSASDLPQGLPVSMTFFDTDNRVIDKQMQTLNMNNHLIYHFLLSTNSQSKTGVYRCVFNIGSYKIRKNIRVETIKPNTTEVVYTFDNEVSGNVYSDIISGKIQARYLTGYSLVGARVAATTKAVRIKQPFKGYSNYQFDLYTVKENINTELFSVVTDDHGRGVFRSDFSCKSMNTPFKLYIETETTMAEGGVSKEGKSLTVYPYTSYVGAVKNEGKGWNGNYGPEENIKISIANLTSKGTLSIKSNTVHCLLQKSVDSWWVDKYRYSSPGNYINYSSWKDVSSKNIAVTGKNTLDFKQGELSEGAYLLTLTDGLSGHSTQVYFTVFGEFSSATGSQPYVVNFETGKESYKVGEDVELMLPAIKGARALISIERGSKILEQKWVNLSGKKSNVKLSTNETWAPNVYIHITVMQPYMQTENDLPLRMYGVKYMKMDASKTPLTLVTDIPETLESNKSYTFNVSEKEGRPMEYTIALVDEGLLGLTGFTTPNPYKHFNGKYPLLVRTWDIYQRLITWFNGKFAGIISIGGDDVYNPDAIAEINRFKPVIQHLGPFKMDAKGKNKHTIQIPNYIGKLRMMIVACSSDNFGNMEKLIPVKNPIMVQSQLPRSLNVSDKLQVPVSIFRDDNSISAFNLTIKADATMIKGLTPATSLNFNGKNQRTHLLNLEVLNKVGKVQLNIGAQAGSRSMTESTSILVNYPHAFTFDSKKSIIEKGKSSTLNISPKGYSEVFKSDITISGVKVPDFTKYADELINYPYGCLEQITSRGYGMMYLDKILSLSPVQEQQRKEHLQQVLFSVSKLQQVSGKFNYWENDYYDAWSDIYAGNFIVEMNNLKNLGMYTNLLEKWILAHTSIANNWSLSEASTEYVYENESLIQAFRLYTLAKAGRSAKSGLNRFIASNQAKNPLTWWLIAGSFKLSGYDTKATEYVSKAEELQKSASGDWTYYNFGSNARNQAIIVEILSNIQPGSKKLDSYYDAMVEACNNESWVSTQTMGFNFIAAYKYFGKALGIHKNIKYTISGITGGDRTYEVSSFETKSIYLKPEDYNKNIKIINQGNSQIYIYQNSKYIDKTLIKPAISDGLIMQVVYHNATNNTSGLDNIRLGDDIFINVTIENPSAIALTHLALNYKVPSGWELINPRLYETKVTDNRDADIQYQDYRDDRVYTFFNLKPGGKKTIRLKAKAAFTGDFYMPAVSCQHMYKGDITASGATGRVVVK